MRRDRGLELPDQHRHALVAALPVADREIDRDTRRARAVPEEHLHRVADVALVALVVFLREGRVLLHRHLRAQRVDARIGGDGVLVVGGSQAPEQQRDRHHVLDAVVAVGGIGERAGLVDDAHARFLGFDDDAVDRVDPVLHLRVQLHRALDRGLRVELGREADLEQHVLHHVAAERLRERDRLALEQHVLEAPGLRRQRRWITHLAGHRDEGVAHRAAGRVSGRPALARAGVRRVPVGAQRTAIDPGVRHRVHHLLTAAAEHRGHDRSRGHPHQQHVIETHAVEAVVEREDALHLVRLDHAGQHVAHGERLAALHDRLARQVIGHSEDAA